MQVSIEKQSDGTFIAYNTTGNMVTLLGTGDTVQEAKRDFMASFDAVKQSYSKRSGKIPPELCEVVVFDIATPS